MELSLRNIGKIGSADIQLKGISVIAGENDTGKSTVGKALFAVFNSFYKIDDKINKNRISMVRRVLVDKYQDIAGRWRIESDTEELIHDLVKDINIYRNNQQKLYDNIYSYLYSNPDTFGKSLDVDVSELVQEIVNVINVSDDEILENLLEKRLYAEFSNQVSNAFSKEKGRINLKIQGRTVEIEIENNNVNHVSNKLDLRTEIVYIDNPFVIDERRNSRVGLIDHKWYLKQKLFMVETEENIIAEIITANKINPELFTRI